MDQMDKYLGKQENAWYYGDVTNTRRIRQWSVETGYDTLESSPFPSPIKQSGGFFNEDVFEHEYQPVADTFPKFRPITKKPPGEIEISPQLETVIKKLAEELAAMEMARGDEGDCDWDFGQAAWMNQYTSPIEMTNQYWSSIWTTNWNGSGTMENNKDGWKYPISTFVPGLPAQRRHRLRKRTPQSTCEFCRNNNDPNYETHQCKNEYGEVLCPILSSLACPVCGATGKQAHTKRYCPVAEQKRRQAIEAEVLGHRIPRLWI